MGKGKKKGYFNNKTKTVKVSPDILLNNTCRLTNGRAKNFPQFPILLRYTDNHDEKHFSIVNKIKNASDEDLDEMIEEYFEYHDKKYGIDYDYNNRDTFSYESRALLIMYVAWCDKNYRLMEKLAKRGVTLNASYDTDDNLFPISYVTIALNEKDKTLLEMTVRNGSRIGRGDLVRTFYKGSNNIFGYLVDNVRDKSVFTGIFGILLIEAKPKLNDTLIQQRVQLLLDKGADPDEKYMGKSMIDYALSLIADVDHRRIIDKNALIEILEAYINTGIGTSYISSIERSEIPKLFGTMCVVNNVLNIKINRDDGIACHTLKLMKYYYDGIEDFIMNKHDQTNTISAIINNTIPQPIAEEIISNIFLL